MSKEKEIKKRFLNSIKLGTGEAYLILKENSKIDFSNLIIKGAIYNYAYDPQSEGSRAKYIFGLIKISEQKDKIVAKLFSKLIEFKEGGCDLYQLCDLMTYLYKDGYTDARKFVNIRYYRNRLEEYGYCGAKELMEIDGLNGVLKVAEYVGEILFNDKEEKEGSWIVDEFQRKNKTINVYEFLKEKGKKNEYIQSYYNEITKNKPEVYKRTKKIRFTYELVTKKLKNNEFFIVLEERANDLTNQEVEKLANDFLDSKNNREKERYLIFFSNRKFPFDYAPLFKLVKGRKLRKWRLVEFAASSLAFFKSPEIRNFAIEKINGTKNPCDYLPLLISNYKKGDNKLLVEIISRSNNFDFIHSLIDGIIGIYKKNKTKECKEPLIAMYNKINCGIHRRSIIEILIENNVLDNKIFNEIKYDSDDDVRKLYREIVKNGR